MHWREMEEMVNSGKPLGKQEAVELLQISTHSDAFYQLLALANRLSRTEYQNQGYIFAQIGLNAEPCSGDCGFCSLAQSHFCVEQSYRLSKEQAVVEAVAVSRQPISDLFLMTTADYPLEDYLDIGAQVRRQMPEGKRLVANIGDFDAAQAEQLKAAGFTGVYHIHRLGEGTDTCLSPAKRLATLDAVKAAGLELYYCVEPIGPEHTPEQLADEMLRAREYGVEVMAAMRRVPVAGTRLAYRGTITLLELTKIVAVTRLVTRPHRSMNVHEPTEMALLAGVNQLYAEYGANPRDLRADTAAGRGLNIDRVKAMLENAEYRI